MKAIFVVTFLFLSLSTFADSTVPVPDPIKETHGTITVHGVAGASQADRKVWIEALAKDKNGNFVRASAQEPVASNLNETVTLPAGSFEVLYSHTMILVDLEAGETKVIELKKISVPKVDGTYKVKLFADLTNAGEFNKYLQAIWSKGYSTGAWDGTDEGGGNSSVVIGFPIPPQMPPDQIQAICHTKKIKWKGAGSAGCSAWMGANALSLGHGAVKTDQSANFWMLDFEYFDEDVNKDNIVTSVQPNNDETKFKNFGRRELGDGVDGDFFSVLPGTYGLEFTSLAGKVSTQLGIVID